MDRTLDHSMSLRQESLRSLGGWHPLGEILPRAVRLVEGGKLPTDIEHSARRKLEASGRSVICFDRLCHSSLGSTQMPGRMWSSWRGRDFDAAVVESMATIDPWNHGGEWGGQGDRLCNLLHTAAEMIRVRLVVVERSAGHLDGSGDKFDAAGNARWTWVVHTGGLLPWMGRRFLQALARWASGEAAAARAAIEALVRSLGNETGAASAQLVALLLSLVAILADPVATPERPAFAPAASVLAAGGKSADYIPLA